MKREVTPGFVMDVPDDWKPPRPERVQANAPRARKGHCSGCPGTEFDPRMTPDQMEVALAREVGL